MKLYLVDTGIVPLWVGTQEKAKDEAKFHGGRWQPREVPTDKPGLIAFLNELEDIGSIPKPDAAATLPHTEAVLFATGGAFDGIETAFAVPPTSEGTPPNARCPGCSRTPRAAEILAQSGDVDAIAGWILEQPIATIERLFAAFGARVGELRT